MRAFLPEEGSAEPEPCAASARVREALVRDNRALRLPSALLTGGSGACPCG